MRDWRRLLVLHLFAAAMAWVEAAVVVYLRTLIGRIEPYQADPLPSSVGLGEIELVREAATLVMLLAAGWLAGGTWRSRLAFAVLAFGAWDLWYYAFLKVTTGWPHSLLDWDILFLLPLPWWGPVLAPASIAALMTAGGSLVAQFDAPGRPVWPERAALLAALAGAGLALYAFMADTLQAAGGGISAVRTTLPVAFQWPVFLVGLALMSVPVLDVAAQVIAPRPARRALPSA